MKLLRLLPRFRQAYRALGKLQGREGWTRTEIEAFQLERLNAVWQHAVTHVRHYRWLAQNEQLPPCFGSLDEFRAVMPFLPRERVRDRPQDFLSEKGSHGVWRSTSGSTGIKTRVFWSHEAHREMLRCKYRFQEMWGLDIFDHTAFLWGQDTSFVQGLAGWIARRRQPLEDWLRNRLRLPAYCLGQDDLRSHLRRLNRFRPAAIYAYATAAYLLAVEAETAGFHCDSLRLVTMTSEPVFPHIVETVQRVFGVPAVAEYGSVECGFMAGEALDRTLRVREDIVLMETQPREDGRHDILVTVLNNPAFPLLRYAIGDVTDAPLQRPERGFAWLHNVAGRDNDLVLSRSGRPLHANWFDSLFEHIDEVRCWRLHQDTHGALHVFVQMATPGTLLRTAALEERFTDLLEGYPVTVEAVPVMPLSGTGKHRWIVSDLARHRQDAALVAAEPLRPLGCESDSGRPSSRGAEA